MRTQFLVCRLLHSHCILTWRESSKCKEVLFLVRTLIPWLVTRFCLHDLSTLQGPHFIMPSYWGLDFQHTNGRGDTNIQSITLLFLSISEAFNCNTTGIFLWIDLSFFEHGTLFYIKSTVWSLKIARIKWIVKWYYRLSTFWIRTWHLKASWSMSHLEFSLVKFSDTIWVHASH